MKRIYLIYVTLFIVFVQACKDDLGNYEYTDTPIVTIDTSDMGGILAVLRYGSLNLAPKINIPSGHEAEYKWILFNRPASSAIPAKSAIISTDAILNAAIGEPEGNYGLEFIVTDKTTGIMSTVVFRVDVTSNLDYGMMVLYQTEEGGDVDFIKTPQLSASITQVEHFKHLFSASYGAQISGTPKFIGNARVNFRPVDWITVGSSNYLGRFNANNFDLLRDQLDIFRRNNTIINPQAYRYISTNYQALINGGKLHVATEITNEIDALFGGPAAGDYELAPYLTSKVNFAIYVVGYDQKNGRFIRYFPSSHTMVDFAAPALNVNQPFDLRNIGKDMLFMGEGRNSHTYSVFKDKVGDRRWLYQIDFSSKSDDGTLGVAVYEMTNLPDAAQAKFYQAAAFGDYIYYATDSKIYNYSYSFSNTASQAFTVPAGEQITSIKFYRPSPNTFVADKEDRVLYVATWDGTKGKVYELGLNETSGMINAVPLNVFEVAGKVVDLSAKTKGNG
ncbi:hypothetical protein FAZ19_04110 [Sphingobacterium alkalisoli]|uniref:PKD-like family protein n=1 Tax=Sphingobacterium alkalisoli TaxID=1874115 RepID=A0A4U0H9H5_9SPHI|nr:PKD-like family lipoprotein [Sphingobacterium alkalisoli]TJY68446.1 hypothetical protein FAZ19_04110 [Sphingobacterium alkalisoli]GGH06439.1 hypothetical protein GCM10011418_03130 [Sphingobacterium alkalisoli]